MSFNNINSPDIIKAYISNADGTEMTLVFNQQVIWNETALIGNFTYHLLDYIYVIGSDGNMISFSADGDTAVLELYDNLNPKTVSYLPNEKVY